MALLAGGGGAAIEPTGVRIDRASVVCAGERAELGNVGLRDGSRRRFQIGLLHRALTSAAAQLDDRERRDQHEERRAEKNGPPPRHEERLGLSADRAASALVGLRRFGRLSGIAILARAFRQRGLRGAASRGDMGVDRALRHGEIGGIGVPRPSERRARFEQEIGAFERARRRRLARLARLAVPRRRLRGAIGDVPQRRAGRVQGFADSRGRNSLRDIGHAERMSACAFLDARDLVFDAPDTIDDPFQNVLEAGQTRLRALVGARLLGSKARETAGDFIVFASGARGQRLQGSARRVEFAEQVGDLALERGVGQSVRTQSVETVVDFGNLVRESVGVDARSVATPQPLGEKVGRLLDEFRVDLRGRAKIEPIVQRAQRLFQRAGVDRRSDSLVDARAEVADHRLDFARRRCGSRAAIQLLVDFAQQSFERAHVDRGRRELGAEVAHQIFNRRRVDFDGTIAERSQRLLERLDVEGRIGALVDARAQIPEHRRQRVRIGGRGGRTVELLVDVAQRGVELRGVGL